MATFALRPTAVRAGPGGRSSVSGATATVFGATGFIGKYVVNELARNGTQVVCPHRTVEEAAMPLRQMGDLGQVVVLKDWTMGNDEMTRYALSRSNVRERGVWEVGRESSGVGEQRKAGERLTATVCQHTPATPPS